MTTARIDRRLLLAAAATVVVLAAGSTVALGAANGAFETHSDNATPSCPSPTLSGTVIAVTLIDMNGMSGMMRGGQSGWRNWHAGMMRVDAAPQTTPYGAVSFKVTNDGVITHELVVLPLSPGQVIGARTVGTDGTVDETGSLAEVSANCTAGKGDGLAPGNTGWTTANLPTGRYELICNRPGHYTAGMYAELDVT
jgi:uncharacterized cupredoxin-like copper-binding protein